MNVLTKEELVEILDRVMQNITGRMASISLCDQDIHFSNDICTVHTTFEGGYNATLLLYADTSLLARLTQQILEVDTIAPQDIEDFTKEYFNVICGQIVARLFQTAHISSRFHIPSFCTGRYVPNSSNCCRCVLNYTSNLNEGAQLIHQSRCQS